MVSKKFISGIGAGMLISALALFFLSPAQNVVLDIEAISNHNGGLASATFPYSRFKKLPVIAFYGDNSNLLEHTVERVQLPDGKFGVKVITLTRPTSKKSYFI